jgi:hypothetical protein
MIRVSVRRDSQTGSTVPLHTPLRRPRVISESTSTHRVIGFFSWRPVTKQQRTCGSVACPFSCCAGGRGSDPGACPFGVFSVKTLRFSPQRFCDRWRALADGLHMRTPLRRGHFAILFGNRSSFPNTRALPCSTVKVWDNRGHSLCQFRRLSRPCSHRHGTWPCATSTHNVLLNV